MKNFLCLCRILMICAAVSPFAGLAQPSNDPASSALRSTLQAKGLFDSDEILDIRLTGNFRALLNDRSDQPKYHPITITYKSEDSSEVSIPIEAKTRGHFRKLKDNCAYPPLLLHFLKGDSLQSSIFRENNKLKLVMPCKGDQFVIHEWLVYKLYNLVTTKSFRARLVRVRLEDDKNKKEATPFYGMLLEEEEQMAKRNGTVEIKRKLRPEQTETNSFLTMSVFEYMIGNTDWSVQYLQNIKLIAPDSNSIPTTVPYDFDMSGIVNTPYAQPAEELNLASVRTRRYRGYCIQDMKRFDEAISLYNRLKENFYSTITNCHLLDEKYIKSTIKFFDEFYTTINNPVALKKEFGYPCDKNGTGNVVIKGLREE